MNDEPLPCPNCGYDLRATTAGRCPECGLTVDVQRLAGRADVPWQNRLTVGRWRGFWRTVFRATLRPGTFAREADRALAPDAARRFRLICCVLAGVTIGAVEAMLYGFLWFNYTNAINAAVQGLPNVAPRTTGGLVKGIAAESLVALTAVLASVVWMLVATGVPRYFFRRGETPPVRQWRDRAMADYSAAPLALLPFALLLTAGVFAIASLLPGIENDVVVAGILAVIAFGPLIVVAVSVWFTPIRMLRRGLRASAWRSWGQAVVSLVAWPVLYALLVLLPAWTVFYAGLVILTWRMLG